MSSLGVRNTFQEICIISTITRHPHTVVFINCLLIFALSDILFYKTVRNTVQIIKYVELSRIQPTLKLLVTFVESLFTLKLY